MLNLIINRFIIDIIIESQFHTGDNEVVIIVSEATVENVLFFPQIRRTKTIDVIHPFKLLDALSCGLVGWDASAYRSTPEVEQVDIKLESGHVLVIKPLKGAANKIQLRSFRYYR